MAQDKIKSLEKKLKALRKKPDKGTSGRKKVDVLSELAYTLSTSDFQKTEYYAKRALVLANKLLYKRGIAWSYYALGRVCMMKCDYNKALDWNIKAAKVIANTKCRKEMGYIYNDIGVSYEKMGNYDNALKYNQKALKIWKILGVNKGIAFSHSNIGNVYLYRSEHAKALKCSQEALRLFTKIKDKYHSAIVLNNLGNINMMLCNYDKALGYYFNAVNIMEKLKNKRDIGGFYSNIGSIYEKQSKYPEALNYHFKGLKACVQFGNKYGSAYALANIGNLYNLQDDYDEALKFYSQSLSIFEKTNDEHRTAMIYACIAKVCRKKGDYATGLRYDFRAIDIYNKIGDKTECSYSYRNVGSTYDKQDNLDKALEYFLKSLAIREEIGHKGGVAESCNDIAGIHIKLKQWDLALACLRRGLSIAQEVGNREVQVYSYQGLHKLFKAQADFKQALEYYEKFTDLEKEILNAEKTRQIAEMRTKYELEKKEKEAEIYRLKNVKLQKEIRERKKIEKKLKKHRDHLEELVAARTVQLRSLAHELSLVEEKQRRKIATYLHDEISQKLALAAFKLDALDKVKSAVTVRKGHKEIKLIIDQAAQLARTLTFEISPPILYEFGLEAAIEWLVRQFSKQHRIPCVFKDDGESKPLSDDTRILLFQSVRELLANVSKHARANNVKVSAMKDDNVISIKVKDDGVGFDTRVLNEKIVHNEGFGLFNVMERLRHMKGQLEIKSTKGHGTSVVIVAPLKRVKRRTNKER
jgi:signal transduction histidine kinase